MAGNLDSSCSICLRSQSWISFTAEHMMPELMNIAPILTAASTMIYEFLICKGIR